MKAVLQRVRRAQVRVDGEAVGTIGQGAVVLLGVLSGDVAEDARSLADRIARFRYHADDEGRMNRSALDLAEAGEDVALLVVSQFTLAADGRKGRRPSFDRAASPEVANELYEFFCSALREHGLRVETGRFRAMMEVELVNDGPVTFVLEEPHAGTVAGSG
ncbi:MAG: D-aminoacyl-tRNA deacylase [Planctomycetota bacterium]